MTRPLCALTLTCLVCACAAPPPEVDGGRRDAMLADATGSELDASSDGPDAGACAPGEVADWICVQGDRETHLCTDSMFPPHCADGRWDCGGGEPAWYVDCWCHVGPWPWPEHASLCSCPGPDAWTCDFPCGPDLLCTVGEEYCEHVRSDVAGTPDSFACRAFVDCVGVPDCECVAAGASSCEAVENGGIRASYPGG